MSLVHWINRHFGDGNEKIILKSSSDEYDVDWTDEELEREFQEHRRQFLSDNMTASVLSFFALKTYRTFLNETGSFTFCANAITNSIQALVGFSLEEVTDITNHLKIVCREHEVEVLVRHLNIHYQRKIPFVIPTGFDEKTQRPAYELTCQNIFVLPHRAYNIDIPDIRAADFEEE